MSEFSTPEQKTEMPTEKRMSHLRKEGNIHFSTELAQVLALVSGFMMLEWIWSGMFMDMQQVLRICFLAIAKRETLQEQDLFRGFFAVILLVGPRILALMLVVATVASLAVLLQTKFNIKEKKFDFKFDRLNPFQGITRIFSLQGFMNTGKAIFKLCIILPIGFFGLKALAPSMIGLIHTSIPDILALIGMGISSLFWKIAYILIAIAIFDLVWGRFQWLKHNKMTKDEVKDERKAVEGDEETRRKIMWKGIQRAMARIKNSVRQADVVITNPTHYAVALKYDRENMAAPIVLAKGMGHMAQRIKKLAREAGIPVLERKPLARALYHSVEVGSEIPRELFKAVAEVLVYVYKLKGVFKRQATQAGV